MNITKTTTKTVTLNPTKTLTKVSNSEVVEIPDSKIVVKDSSARAVYGADTVAKLQEMSTIGLRLNSAESKITQLENFEASNDSTLAQLKTTIESDYQTADNNAINSSKTYTDTTVASESQARAVSEQQLRTDFESADTQTNSRIDTVETSISDESQARATSIAQLDTAYKNADTQLSNSLIQYTNDSVSTESEARASAISTLTTNYNNVTAQLQSIDTTLSTVNGWSASSSKLITDSDGNITGWKFADGSYQDSSFTIYADTFRLGNGSTNDTPFEIDVSSGKAKFKGIVEFTNTDMSAYENSNLDWQTEVQNALDNDATTIDGGKIVTGSISANKINTTGLIAENISADMIIGKTFEGGIINGARINGAVIKASYLDLDGELEVLTNYHIPVSTYNVNPSLYSDAVYIEADNEYRIPTISTVREETKSSTFVNGGSFSSKIRSYNCGNAGHNLKVRSIKPTVDVTADVNLITIDNLAKPNNSVKWTIYVGGVSRTLEIISGEADSKYSLGCYTKGLGYIKLDNTAIVNNPSYNSSGTLDNTFTINGITFKITTTYAYSCYQTVEADNSSNRYANILAVSYTLVIVSGSYTLANNWTNTNQALIYVINNTYPSSVTASYNMTNGVLINNMV